MPNVTPQKILEQQTDRFFAEMGLADLAVDEKKRYMEQITEIILGRSIMIVLDRLGEKGKREAFQALTTDQERSTFCTQEGIDLEGIILQEAERYRTELLSHSAYVQGYLDGQRKA